MAMKEYLNGMQHIGIPTKDVDATVAFYEKIGLETFYRKNSGGDNVAFLRLGSLVIETYHQEETAQRVGAIDHITIDVTDIGKVFEHAKANGYALIDQEIVFLDFFDRGVKYFMIEGPNKERIEFNQVL